MAIPQQETTRIDRVNQLFQAHRTVEEVLTCVESVVAQVEGATPQEVDPTKVDPAHPTLCSLLNEGPDYLQSRFTRILDRLNYLGEILR